jgi:hypothetical protein
MAEDEKEQQKLRLQGDAAFSCILYMNAEDAYLTTVLPRSLPFPSGYAALGGRSKAALLS